MHSHFLTPKIDSSISTFISVLTETWQASLSPSRASFLVIWLVSVGRISPPPSKTLTLHCPQVPPPPHALGTKISALPRAFKSFEPAASVKSFFSFKFILTSPVLTSLDLAARIIVTRVKTIKVNIKTPRKIVLIITKSPKMLKIQMP